MDVWYKDQETYRLRLEAAGSINKLAATTGVARSTLQDWKQKHGIVDTPEGIVEAEAELVKSNALLKLENRALRQNATKSATGELEADRLLQRLEESIGRWRPDFSARELPEPPTRGDRTAQDLVLDFSDLHAAEVVSLEETRGLNEYNWDIMVDRMWKTQTSVISHVEHFGFDIATFHIHLLGDMLSGNIHAELAMTNDRPLAEAVVDLAQETIPWLETFASYFHGSKIKVAGVPGNHPRAWAKPQAKMAHDNADWVYYKMLETAFRGHPQFVFDFPRGALNEQIIAERWRLLMMHGDGIRSSMPTVPWAGVLKRLATLEAQFTAARKPIDFFSIGHFHQVGSFSGIGTRAFMNGSTKGLDEYSLKMFGSGRAAEQLMITFHPVRGYTGQHPLHLQPVMPAAEGWS